MHSSRFPKTSSTQFPHDKKCLKRKDCPLSLSLGVDVQLKDLANMEKVALVGRFASKRPYVNSIKTKTSLTFATWLKYKSVSLVFVEDLQLQASHSPQESTRRPIYTITEAPGREVVPTSKRQNNKVI
jgi:hypothetical protein